MLELRDDSFAKVLAFLIILCFVPSQCGQDGDTTPFGAFVKRYEQFLKGILRDDEKGLFVFW